MIIFDQLRISDDGKKMYIDAHVSQATVFADTIIEKLIICLADEVSENETIDPESIPNIFYKEYITEDTKEIHEVISIDDEDLHYSSTTFKDLFFVYIKCDNVPEESTCYTAIGNYVLGVLFDTALFYRTVMQHTKELNKSCEIPKSFIDLILLWNGFNAAVKTGHYLTAIDFYNKLFENSPLTAASSINNICGCHG